MSYRRAVVINYFPIFCRCINYQSINVHSHSRHFGLSKYNFQAIVIPRYVLVIWFKWTLEGKFRRVRCEITINISNVKLVTVKIELSWTCDSYISINLNHNRCLHVKLMEWVEINTQSASLWNLGVLGIHLNINDVSLGHLVEVALIAISD